MATLLILQMLPQQAQAPYSTFNNLHIPLLQNRFDGILSKSATSGDVTLTAPEAMYGIVKVTGAPGVARSLVFPLGGTGPRTIINDCGQNVTVKCGSGDTGVVVSSGFMALVVLDGAAAKMLPRPTSASTADTVVYRDASGRAQVEDPSANKDIANRQWVLAEIAAAIAAL